MATKAKKYFFTAFKERLKRYHITIINASVTVSLIGIVIIVLLSRFSALQRRTAEESVISLAGMTANEVQSVYLTYFDVVRTVSNIMKSYNAIEVDRRRTFFNDIMLGILNSNRSLISIYTIWKPNGLDGMDSDYINTPDSDETGQYITGFTRERGWIEQKAFTEYKYLLNIYNNVLSEFISATISEPMPKTVEFKNTWIIDIQVPILRDNLAIGVVGATINLEQLQNLIETKKPYTSGRSMVVSRNGNIVAHYNSKLRGLDLPNTQIYDPLFPAEIHSRIYTAILDSMINLQPEAQKTDDTLIVSYPVQATNPRLATFASNEITNPPWAVITLVPLSTVLSPIKTLLRFSLFFIVGAGILAATVVFLTSSSLTQRARHLQQDLERATTLQDNVKYGLFLMDHKYVIQGAYSKALEKILSVPNLQGKVFTDLLRSSLRANEQQGLLDYFEMIFKRSFDSEMLETINPIDNLTYTSIDTGEIKSLHTGFTLAEWGRGHYILGTLEDVTAEKELEKQLINAENQKEKEMQALFQVIQLNPRVLNDFIEDAEYEFGQINELLKNRENNRPQVLVEMYQSIHAVKSNALILNLENFSNKLHKMETSIKTMQEENDGAAGFDDFLGLVLELDEVMKEKDQLKDVITKIENYKLLSGSEQNQEQYVLVETLNQVCAKARAAMGRKAKLKVEEIDEAALKYGPRRIIKEVLTQLIRNAVCHGIESPQERELAGKGIEGEIRLSIRHENGKIFIKLSDDGKGIDFNKIRQTALEKKLFKNPKEVNDKANLLRVLFSPGYSSLPSANLQAGRGIGLSLVRDRVKLMNGNINVLSAPGKGTVFTVIIPLQPEAGANAGAGVDLDASMDTAASAAADVRL